MYLIFPEDLPEVHSLDALVQSNEPTIWPCIEPEMFRRAPYHALGVRTFDYRDSLYLRDDEHQGSGWAVVRAKDVMVRGVVAQTLDGGVLTTVPWWRLGATINYFNGADRVGVGTRLEEKLSSRPPLEIMTIEEPCTLFYQGPHGHWLYEGLFPMAIWQKIGFKPSLLSTDPCPDYRRGFLDLMDYPKDKRIFADGKTHDFFCKELWLPFPWRDRKSALWGLGGGWTKDHKYCYEQNDWWFNTSGPALRMTRALAAKAPAHLGRGERIFVQREGTAFHRICLNEVEAAHIAEKHGFVAINPSLLTGEEEAAIFHQAKIICGSAGGGIFNTVFSQPGTRVICYGAEDDVVWPLQSICSINQLELTIVRSTQFCSIDHLYNGTLSLYALDLIALDELLESFD